MGWVSRIRKTIKEKSEKEESKEERELSEQFMVWPCEPEEEEGVKIFLSVAKGKDGGSFVCRAGSLKFRSAEYTHIRWNVVLSKRGG